MNDRVILIGCVKGKRDEPAPARDLYTSSLFKARLGYAEASGRPWGVLSALYGAVHPDRVLRPYDWTIQRRWTRNGGGQGWAIGVIQACFELAGHTTTLVGEGDAARRIFANPLTIEIHAGVDYADLVWEVGVPAFDGSADIHIEHPVVGMGIGQQKRYYASLRPPEPESIWRVIARQRHQERTRA